MQEDRDLESHTGPEGGAETDSTRQKHRDACKKYYESRKRKRDRAEPTAAATDPDDEYTPGQYLPETPMAAGYSLPTAYFNPYAVFSHEEAVAIKMLAKEAHGERSRGAIWTTPSPSSHHLESDAN